MPDPSYIRIITEFLKSKLEHKIILDWVFVKGQYINKNPVGFIKFKNNSPYKVENIQCKGSLIYITLFNEYGYFYIINTLKSDNSFFQEYKDSDCSFCIKFKSGISACSYDILWFKDPNFLSTTQFTYKETVLKKILEKVGPDILSEDISLTTWKNLISTPQYINKTILSVLADNRAISGLGVSDKSEALFYAGIAPLRKIGSLSEEETDKLYEALRIITRISYNKKGLSQEDFLKSTSTYGGLKIYEKSGAKKIKTIYGDIIYWDSKKQI